MSEDEATLTRRDAIVGTGLLALLFGSSVPASAQSTEDGRRGYACRWRADINADSYGLYDAGIIDFLDIDESGGRTPAGIVNRNGTLYVRRWD